MGEVVLLKMEVENMKNKIAPIDFCPHCGSNEGFYTKMQARGSVINRMNFDGSEAENGDMYEGLRFVGGEYAWCQHCHKRLFKMQN